MSVGGVVAETERHTMSEEQKEPRTKLHVFRVRARGESDFYDPQTDVRKLLPYIGLMVIEDLRKAYGENPEAQYALSYLWNCVNVFRIRVSEDPTPLNDQMLRFIEAISQVPEEILHKFTTSIFIMLTVVYAVYQRRDIMIDGPGQAQMLATARLADFMALMPSDVRALIHLHLGKDPMFKEQIVSVDPRSTAKVVKDGKEVATWTNLKERARLFIQAEGDTSWEGIAEACDQAFTALAPELTNKEKAALCLAYPDYKFTTQCEFDDDGEEDNTPGKDSPTA